MASKMFILKISVSPETRRIRLEKPPSYEQLLVKIQEVFPQLDLASQRIVYRDSDGDFITFSSQSELDEALSEFNWERLFIRVRPRTRCRGKGGRTRLVKPKESLAVAMEACQVSQAAAQVKPSAPVEVKEAPAPAEVKEDKPLENLPMPEMMTRSFHRLASLFPVATPVVIRDILLACGGRFNDARQTLRAAFPGSYGRNRVGRLEVPRMTEKFSASARKLASMYGGGPDDVATMKRVTESLVRHGGDEPNTCLSLMNESVNPCSFQAAKEASLAEKRREDQKRRQEARKLLEERRAREEAEKRRLVAEREAAQRRALEEQKRIREETRRQLQEAREAREKLEREVAQQRKRQLLLSILDSCQFTNETAAADYRVKLELISDMGFDLRAAHHQLQRANGNVEDAVEQLMAMNK